MADDRLGKRAATNPLHGDAKVAEMNPNPPSESTQECRDLLGLALDLGGCGCAVE